MTLKTPIEHSCNIKCPVCGHKFLYDFKIQDFDKVDSKEKSEEVETKYKFETYLICKNPLCNYDIEVKGDVFEYPENTLKCIEISYIN